MVSNLGSLSGGWKESGVVDLSEPLVVTSCGFQRFLTKDFSISRPRGRDDYQLIYLLEGKGSYRWGAEDEASEVAEGHLVVFRPGDAQRYTYRHRDRTSLYWLHLTGSAAGQALAAVQLPSGASFVGIDKQAAELFEKIIRELQLKAPWFRQTSAGLLQQLLGLLARRRNCAAGDHRPIPDDIGRVVELMYRHSDQPYSADRYAEVCHLSVYRFIHKFREVTGQSPLEYLTGIRIAAAKELLANSSYNVAEVAGVVGYENPLYFSRLFKKVTGVSPKAYRQSPA